MLLLFYIYNALNIYLKYFVYINYILRIYIQSIVNIKDILIFNAL